MRRTFLLSLALVHVLTLASLTGCGSEEEAPPVASIKASEPTKTERPKLDHLHPVVQVRTTAGDIVLQLDAENAPVTVHNFLAYANSGHYDGTVFHDVEKGFIVLGGGYDAGLAEKPTDLAIRNEAHNGLKNARGTVAMARRPDVIDSSTSMFFFNAADNTILNHKGDEAADYGYCVFGKVIEGLDVVDKIAKTPTRQVDQFERMPTERIAIQSIRRVR
ncbi:MAG: peptidylprolyl isomerase [Pirellulales bacterium]